MIENTTIADHPLDAGSLDTDTSRCFHVAHLETRLRSAFSESGRRPVPSLRPASRFAAFGPPLLKERLLACVIDTYNPTCLHLAHREPSSQKVLVFDLGICLPLLCHCALSAKWPTVCRPIPAEQDMHPIVVMPNEILKHSRVDNSRKSIKLPFRNQVGALSQPANL